MPKNQYAWVTYGTQCEICGEHLEGIATAKYDGRAKEKGRMFDLYHFSNPLPKCPNGHQNEYYIHEVKQ